MPGALPPADPPRQMHGMPHRRRSGFLATIAVVALVVSACIGETPTPTSIPATLAPATPSPAPTPIVTAQPTFAPTPRPTVNCTASGASEAGMNLLTPVGFETVDLQTGALESPIAVEPSEVPIVSTVVGGIELQADLHVGDGLEATTVISAITADFVPFGLASALPVTATFSGSTASLRLPDKRVDGQLRVAISWTTECGTGQSTGTIGLTVVPSSVTAGCPTAADDLADALSSLGKAPRVTIGTLVEPITVVAWSGRWILGNGASDVPQFAGWDDSRAVVAAPEAPIVVRESIDDLALVMIQAGIFRRADVDAYLAGGSIDDLETLAFVRRNANAKGRASIPAPLEPGRYVIELTGSWLTSCLSVETYNVVSLQVR